jgi:hypothetical protein
LLEEAALKFRAAVDLVPREPQYWFNLAAATSLQVFHGNSPNHEVLLTSACEFYKRGIEYRPGGMLPGKTGGKPSLI